jgi:hypothetical protein
MTTQKPILMCDVDSTITDHWHRIRRHTKPSWPGNVIDPKAFTQKEVLMDSTLPNCKTVLTLLARNYFTVRYLTARGWPDSYAITVEQLKRFGVPNPTGVTIVHTMSDKVAKVDGAAILIDDFMTGQENNIGTFHSSTAHAIQARGTHVVVFRNDWLDVLEQVERWMETQRKT